MADGLREDLHIAAQTPFSVLKRVHFERARIAIRDAHGAGPHSRIFHCPPACVLALRMYQNYSYWSRTQTFTATWIESQIGIHCGVSK
jgi:hypothetical protein